MPIHTKHLPSECMALSQLLALLRYVTVMFFLKPTDNAISFEFLLLVLEGALKHITQCDFCHEIHRFLIQDSAKPKSGAPRLGCFKPD